MLARIRKSIDEKDQGFTLIELLVVMIIIGILAAIAIPLFLNQRKKGVDASMKSDLKSAATMIETYMTENPVSAVPDGAAGANAALTGFTASDGTTSTQVRAYPCGPRARFTAPRRSTSPPRPPPDPA